MAFTTYILFFCIISQISNIAHCTNDDIIKQIGIKDNTTITTGDYPNNVNSLLSVFTNESSRGFFNSSSGEGADRSYGLYLCRGDLSSDKCNDCLQDIKQYFITKMNNNTLLFYLNGLVYDTQVRCFVHYSNSSDSLVYRANSSVAGGRYGDALSGNPQYSQYNQVLFSQLEELSTRVGNGNSTTKANFETSVTYLGGKRAIDVIVQCTPDISAMNCSSCVRDLYSSFMPTTVGGYIVGTNCLLRYGPEDFIETGRSPGSFMPSFLQVMLVLLGTMFLTFK